MKHRNKIVTILILALVILALIPQPATASPANIRLTLTPGQYIRPGKTGNTTVQVRLSDKSANIWVYGAQLIAQKSGDKYPMTWVDCSTLNVCYVKFNKVPLNTTMNLQICYYDKTHTRSMGNFKQSVTVTKSMKITVPKSPGGGGSYPGYSGPANPLP